MAPDSKTVAEALLLIEAQAQAREQITQLTQAGIEAEIRLFAGWYSSLEITKLAGRLAKLTRASQKQTALSTDSFAVRILRLLVGKRPSPVGAIPVADLRAGVTQEQVYGRLADQYRWLHATRSESAPVVDRVVEGRTMPPLPRLSDEAILDRIVLRGKLQADDSLSLAMRDQWAAELDAAPPAVTGWRRIIHPELVAVGSTEPGPVCGLCVVASDRAYHRIEKIALHERCRCEVLPIAGEPGGDGDPGIEVARRDLNEVYKRAGTTNGPALKRTKFTVQDHGELGPRLVYAGHHSKSAAAASKDGKRLSAPGEAIEVDAQRVLEVAEKTIASLLERQAAGEDVSVPLKFQRALAKRMRGRLDAG